MKKPAWWPENPYPKSVFPMQDEEYLKIVPDPHVRTALSGCLGRLFWNIASESIWAAVIEAGEDSLLGQLDAHNSMRDEYARGYNDGIQAAENEWRKQ